MHKRHSLACFLLLFTGLCTAAETKPSRPELDDKDFTIRLAPRTPNQISAFYEARGFPDVALAEIKQTCFITIGLRNKSDTTVWFDLRSWRFTTAQGPLQRILRDDWNKRWEELGLEKRFQATFRWTLMPEELDFRPHETEGGNVTLPWTDQPITITGELFVGKQKNRLYQLKFENVICAKD